MRIEYIYVPIHRGINTILPMVGGATLADNLTLSIIQATSGTDGYVTSTDWTIFNSKMSNVMTHLGDIIYGGASGTPTKLGIGAAGTVLHGGTTPTWDTITEANLSLSNNTTANASSSQHGFLPRLSNTSTQYLDGTGNWSIPPVTSATTVTVTALRTLKSVATSTYTIKPTDQIVEMTVSGILTMPPADNHTGLEITIDNSYTSSITIVPSGAQTIQGETTQTLPPNSSMWCYSDNSNWRII